MVYTKSYLMDICIFVIKNVDAYMTQIAYTCCKHMLKPYVYIYIHIYVHFRPSIESSS